MRRSRLAIAAAVLFVALFVMMRVYVRGKSASPSGSSSVGKTHRPPPRALARPPRSVFLSGAEVVPSDERIGQLSGRVVSSDDYRGIPEAELTFVGPKGAESFQSQTDGTFAFSPSVEGTYELTLASAKGFLSLSSELGQSAIRLVARKGRSIRGVTISLSRAVSYRGIVLDPANAPVPGASVRIHDGEDSELSTFVSDAKGEFGFRAPEGAILEATRAGFSPGRAKLDLSAMQAQVVRIRLGPNEKNVSSASITGRVVDETKLAIPDAVVVARVDSDNPATDEAQTNPGARTRTNENGEFTLSGLIPGRYSVAAADGDHAPARQTGVTTAGPPITLVLTQGARLSGRVSDEKSGAPIAAFSIALGVRDGPLAVHSESVTSHFDADGRYSIELLRPGTYLVTIAAAGFAPTEREVVVKADESADFALGRGASAFGAVLHGKDGPVLAGARVALEGRLGTGNIAPVFFTSAITDAKGEFELTGITAGEHSLFASAKDHHSRVLGGLLFRMGERSGPLRIELTPTKPGEDPRVELVGIGAVLAAKDDVLVIGKTLPGGGAEIAGLVSGDAIVSVEGIPVKILGFEGAIQKIRGPENTTVNLSVKKANAGEPTNVSVVRRRVQG